ncbi:conserved hypothetical protein [Thermosinus carboxydivorans Nor1]|uniref:Uncharacterized protein n=1 Tax=Thermosinus carboxydivorans Nor1 TaxID=401526 RepID=A1HT55_9FIRM|nr:DUF6470 family protein [Thermosinus carboxydivorans]EAX46817.1 conserved hypothetical protein [Thermosinus carboxydivorans Nor1]
MLYLNIRTQTARLEFASYAAALNLKTTPASLELATEPARVEIRQPKGELYIDQSPCRASRGIYGPSEFARVNAEQGRRTALETVGRIAEEGDRMAAIESGEDAIVNMAIESNYPPPPDITWAWVDPPIIRYTARPAEIDVQRGRVNAEFVPGKVEGEYTPGKVDVRIARYPSIKMWVTENKYDVYV